MLLPVIPETWRPPVPEWGAVVKVCVLGIQDASQVLVTNPCLSPCLPILLLHLRPPVIKYLFAFNFFHAIISIRLSVLIHLNPGVTRG